MAESAEKACEENAAAKDEDELIRWLLNQVLQRTAATSRGSTYALAKLQGLQQPLTRAQCVWSSFGGCSSGVAFAEEKVKGSVCIPLLLSLFIDV